MNLEGVTLPYKENRFKKPQKLVYTLPSAQEGKDREARLIISLVLLSDVENMLIFKTHIWFIYKSLV